MPCMGWEEEGGTYSGTVGDVRGGGGEKNGAVVGRWDGGEKKETGPIHGSLERMRRAETTQSAIRQSLGTIHGLSGLEPSSGFQTPPFRGQGHLAGVRSYRTRR